MRELIELAFSQVGRNFLAGTGKDEAGVDGNGRVLVKIAPR
jgi:hypothetical protein